MSLPRMRGVILALASLTVAIVGGCGLPLRPRTGSAVVQVRVVPESVTLDPNQTQPFVASGRTAAGDTVPIDVTWTASAGSITSDGLYTADTSATDVTITATMTSAHVTGTSHVRKRRVTQIFLTPAAVSLRSGGTQQFDAWGMRNTGDTVAVAVTYSASGGTITSGGLFTAGQTTGSYRVMARLTNGALADTSAVTVTAIPVASVTVAPSSAGIQVGDTLRLTATPRDSAGNVLSGRTITWSSDSSAVATVNASGLVTGVASGSATIRATSEGKSGTAAITVTSLPPPPPPPPPVATVTVSPSSAAIHVGDTLRLSATLRDSAGNPLSGRTITWSSDSAAVASVSGSGLVTGLRAGTAIIRATSEGKSGTATITVTVVPVASVTVTPGTAGIRVSDTLRLRATLRDSAGNTLTGRTITWSSDSAAVATVNSSGLVTGLKAGTATIRATSEGKSSTATITVTLAPVASVTVSPSTVTLQVGGTAQLTATLKDSAGRTLSGRTITWSSDSASVATVSASGLVTAVKAGTATIRATSEGKSGTAVVTVTTPGSGGVPQAGHVFIVTEENTNYASVIGSSSMPYLNSLAQQYGLATQYYGNTHPSIGNYFELATGQIITNNDSYSTIVTVDNVVRRLLAAGKTWRSYAEDLPSVGYTGGDVGNYARKHNVFALLSDVANDTVQRKNLVPFTQFATDLAGGTLPHFSNIVPNLCNDAHDCSLTTADTWLRNNIAPLIASPTFQQDGLLIIVFDESGSDNTNGGGRIAWVVVGPKAKLGYQSTTLYQHQSTLRLILEALGVTQYPGAAATAPAMAEFFAP